MMLVEDTTVATAALPLAQFRDHLRLGSGFAEDTLQDGVLESFLRAALSAVEARTSKVLYEREFTWTVEQLTDPGCLTLPVAPVSAVSEIAVVSVEGDEEVIASDRWRLTLDAQRPLVTVLNGTGFNLPTGGRLRLRFLAGFGVEWSDVPADLRQAVLMLAAHYYEYRHETTLGPGCMPFGVTALLERYRDIRISGWRV